MIDILIPVYTKDTPFEELKRCVVSIIAHTPDCNIILACSDQKQQININRALERAKGDFVCIFDWDVYVCDGWLDKLLEKIKADEKIGIIGPKMTGKYAELGGASSKIADGETKEVSDLPGGLMLFRNLGFKWDEVFESGVWADTDFCRQYKEKGYKIVLTGDVSVEHDHLDITKFGSRSDFYIDGKKKYMEKWGDKYNNADISVLLLSWNELNVIEKSLPLLKADKLDIWVVDNGSTDGTREYLKKQKGINVITFDENMGISYARNRVIEQCKGEYIFMLDGDIKYIPGAAESMKETLKTLPQNTYCFGVHNPRWDGTQDENEATQAWSGTGTMKNNVAIAWTQFGIFKGDIVRKYKFPEYGPYFGPGYGFEDDWMHAKLEEDGYVSYYCEAPLYYHDKHKTMQLLSPEAYQHSMDTRKAELLRRFPGYIHWSERPM